MSALFKILMFTSPILAVVLYFVLVKMERHDIQMEKEAVEFTQNSMEFKEEFEAFLDPKKEAALYSRREAERLEAARALRAEEEQLKNRKAENDRRSSEFDSEFNNAMKEFEISKKEGAR